MSVPETDASICCATSGRQDSSLIGIPRDSFDCGLMLSKFGLGLFALEVPYHQFIIIASTGELLAIEAPF